jgi:hypothetical protein
MEGKMLPKLALEADPWYNKPINIVVSGGTGHTPDRTNLIRRLIMDSLHPHGLFQQELSFTETPQVEKTCTGPCGRTLPATPEIFGYDRRVKDGLQACCKECKNAKRRKPPAIKDVPEGYKLCTGPCGRTLPATPEHFCRRKDKKDGLNNQCLECRRQKMNDDYKKPEYQKRRLEYYNRPDVVERERSWQQQYRQNPEVRKKHREFNRKRYHRPEVREKVLEYSRQPEIQAKHRANELRRTRNPHIRAKKYAQQREYHKTSEWKAKRHIWYANRRARKRAVRGKHTTAQIQEQLKRQRYRCYYAACGHSKFERKNGKYIYHIDHTFPLSRVVGTDIPANDIGYLVLTCPSCNTSKGSKYPWEWLDGGRLC